jgi:hypothetical protein
MNLYIKPFEPINESMKQHGIILIKGKHKGKNKEQMLFATHVNTWAELRPGAMMMFLSDTFYRVIKDGDKLKGVKINWRDEDSLKDSLNFKAPGKLSVVRNNNKTPYHWKTLKHTNLRDALDSVEEDLLGSSFVFESSDSFESIKTMVIEDSIDAIFKDGKNVIVLDWDIPDYDLTDNIDSSERHGTERSEWEATFDCIHVGRPELDEDLKEMELDRFEVTVYFETTFSFEQWYDPGDRDTPPDGDIEITNIDTDIVSISIGGIEVAGPSDLKKIIGDPDGPDFESFIKKKHERFI